MEDLGDINTLFTIQTLFGLSIVAVKSLKISWWKLCFTVSLMVVYLYEFVVYLVSETDLPYLQLNKFHGGVGYVVNLLLLTSVLLDHTTLITTALNLKAAEELLKREITSDFVVRGEAFFYAVLFLKSSVSFIYACATWFFSLNRTAVTSYFTNFHGFEMYHVIGFLYLVLKSKVNCMYRELNKKLKTRVENESTPSQQVTSARYSKRFDSENKTLLKTSKNVRGSLSESEENLLRHFGVWLAYILSGIAIQTPNVLYLLIFESVWHGEAGVFRYTVAGIQNISNIVFVILLMKSSEDTVSQHSDSLVSLHLVRCRSKERFLRAKIKHQTLASLHRSALSCAVFFDLEYSFIQDMIDTSILVLSVRL